MKGNWGTLWIRIWQDLENDGKLTRMSAARKTLLQGTGQAGLSGFPCYGCQSFSDIANNSLLFFAAHTPL
jgi:hypothetical protein